MTCQTTTTDWLGTPS